MTFENIFSTTKTSASASTKTSTSTKTKTSVKGGGKTNLRTFSSNCCLK